MTKLLSIHSAGLFINFHDLFANIVFLGHGVAIVERPTLVELTRWLVWNASYLMSQFLSVYTQQCVVFLKNASPGWWALCCWRTRWTRTDWRMPGCSVRLPRCLAFGVGDSGCTWTTVRLKVRAGNSTFHGFAVIYPFFKGYKDNTQWVGLLPDTGAGTLLCMYGVCMYVLSSVVQRPPRLFCHCRCGHLCAMRWTSIPGSVP